MSENWGKICRHCSLQLLVGPQPDPFPRPVPDPETGHYRKYDETPRFNDALKERLPDDYQPRAQLKKSFKEGRITTEDLDAVKQFARNYLVTERQALDF